MENMIAVALMVIGCMAVNPLISGNEAQKGTTSEQSVKEKKTQPPASNDDEASTDTEEGTEE